MLSSLRETRSKLSKSNRTNKNRKDLMLLPSDMKLKERETEKSSRDSRMRRTVSSKDSEEKETQFSVKLRISDNKPKQLERPLLMRKLKMLELKTNIKQELTN